jgi:glycosyltransferase involved in cell wall biosynthesis
LPKLNYRGAEAAGEFTDVPVSRRLKVWIITVGEPLPVDGADARLYRSGILSYLMAEQGHDVTWWSSSFDHVAKKHRVREHTDIDVVDNLRLTLLHGPGYRRNISLRRIFDHMIVARGFRRLARDRQKPDIILVSYPTIELSWEAVSFGDEFDIPVIVDVRDLWPDIFEQAFPGFLKNLVHPLLLPLDRKAREVFGKATAITGITDEIMDWGLAKGGRQRSAKDRSFPFGYDASGALSADKPAAVEFWREHGVSEDDWNICFFGTLGRQFDLATVIDAARELLHTRPRVRFVICGEGDLKQHFEDLARDVPTVIFPGWVDRVQIRALMEMSRIGLAPYLPSRDFLMSLPNKPIEYMSAGLPVLSTIDGVLGQLISQHEIGVVCNEPDAGTLAAEIARLVGDPERIARMGKAALQLFERDFDANVVYSGFSTYLQEFTDKGFGRSV